MKKIIEKFNNSPLFATTVIVGGIIIAPTLLKSIAQSVNIAVSAFHSIKS